MPALKKPAKRMPSPAPPQAPSGPLARQSKVKEVLSTALPSGIVLRAFETPATYGTFRRFMLGRVQVALAYIKDDVIELYLPGVDKAMIVPHVDKILSTVFDVLKG